MSNPISFTAEQLAVIKHRGGHALVSAVAGSGKTEVLVARTVEMVDEGIDPDSMLILMFNKSAQEVFVQRLHEQRPDWTVFPEVLTFHALGLRIIDIYADRKHLPAPEMHDDSSDWISLMLSIVDACNSGTGLGINSHPDQLQKYCEAVEYLKNMDYPYQSVTLETLGWTAVFWQQMQVLFPAFEAERKKRKWISLNDLLYEAVAILRANDDYADEWQDSLNHILVDEYQDSNPLQHWILRRFTKPSSSLMVVGDEDQCIYTWRAADPDMMVRGFELQYPDTKRYMLSHTFRYGHAVALMANHVLQHNKVRPEKLVVSGTGKSGSIEVIRGADTRALVPVLKRLRECDAILVREFRHADDIEVLMQWHKIPYRLEGAEPFPQRMSGLVLRMCLGCAMEKSYLPPVTQAKAWIRWVDPEASSLFVEHLSNTMQRLGVERALRQTTNSEGLSVRQQNHLVQMLVFNGRLRDAVSQPDPVDCIRRRMKDAWSRSIEKQIDRLPAPFIVQAMEEFGLESLQRVVDFLEQWTVFDTGPLLTSIHRSKGGGWPIVLLPHTETDRFPSTLSEEERRLFYVAITRSKEELILFCPNDPVRDALWNAPIQADLDSYKGPTGRFALESYPEYALKIARQWVSTGKPSSEVLTPTARRYEAILYPSQLKSKGLWSKLKN